MWAIPIGPVRFKKKKNQVKSPRIWSRVPETGSDPPIGSGWEPGRDMISVPALLISTSVLLISAPALLNSTSVLLISAPTLLNSTSVLLISALALLISTSVLPEHS